MTPYIRTTTFVCRKHPSLGQIDWCPKCSCGEPSDATLRAMLALDEESRAASMPEGQRAAIVKRASRCIQAELDAGTFDPRDATHYVGCAVDEVIHGAPGRDELLSSRDHEWT